MRRKKIAVFIIISLITLFLVGCACSHEWQDATCYAPKTCSKCNETEGGNLSHLWLDATCTTAVTCSICGEVAGNALGHQWQDATCDKAKTCSVCSEKEGEVLGHQWQEATCDEAKTCSTCATTEGEALGHQWKNATYTSPKTCTICGITSGEPLKEVNTSVVGTYYHEGFDNGNTYSSMVYFYDNGEYVYIDSRNDGTRIIGTWTQSGKTVNVTYWIEGGEVIYYDTYTIVNGGLITSSGIRYNEI